jgi:hypothetical protein
MRARPELPATTLLVLGLTLGCVMKAPAIPSAGYEAPPSESYAGLADSLFPSDAEVLSAADIERILGTDVVLPVTSHLAVLRLGSSSEILGWSLLDPQLSAVEDNPFASLAASSRIRRISWLPSLLVPDKKTVPHLREAAARFQADLLLVLRTPCRRFSDYRWFRADRSKVYCLAEALLLDVRSGIIPFSTLAVREVSVLESESSISMWEANQKAEAQATIESVGLAADDLAQYLSGLPETP